MRNGKEEEEKLVITLRGSKKGLHPIVTIDNHQDDQDIFGVFKDLIVPALLGFGFLEESIVKGCESIVEERAVREEIEERKSKEEAKGRKKK